MPGIVVNLFAGPGGWCKGLESLSTGLVSIGIEYDKAACATRAAAGHLTIRADVSTYPLAQLAGKVEGLIASPPCPDFSAAGKRKGINGTSGHLIFEVMRWASALRPRWIACEQVPEVLPWWRKFAADLREQAGYKTWAGILCAADYGVPQERYRAFLLAHLDRQPQPPAPTHTEHPHPSLLGGPTLPKWVSMAEGLGWGMMARPYVTVTTGGASSGGADRLLVGGSGARRTVAKEAGGGVVVGYRRTRGAGMSERDGERPDTPADEPAPTITGLARSDSLLIKRGALRVKATATMHERYREVDQPAPPPSASGTTPQGGSGSTPDSAAVPARDPEPRTTGARPTGPLPR